MRRLVGAVVLVCGVTGLVGRAQEPEARPPQARVLIVSGAPGSDEYAERQRGWRETLVSHLVERAGLPVSRLDVLAEAPNAGHPVATAANVRATVERIRSSQRDDDTLLVVLFGHGTFDGVDAKFNLVGPDLDAMEWRAVFRDVPGRLVFVQTASASFPFLKALAGPDRIVMTATASVGQKYDTVFAEYFVAAFAPGATAADLDDDGRISMWEAFAFASAQTQRYYELRGQLPVEKALLDDTGDGVGRDLLTDGPAGLLASRTFLDPDPLMATGDPSVTLLIGRRNTLEQELDELKRKKSFMPAADYATELERLIVDIARTSREIRLRSGS